ncbi:hypothetical protein BCR44DRAFT_1439656 [Catenaria anguillulae PL171]|uniref:Uncharacterized protein n=1 Tax=Catenaria anguillulae PL171 TaxID=765915 RepID=A0A1Y2HDJ9_9FUNG|nr:hypothetical protein BCR44DRAFT_1439656 [Catenaria anguillulae PL171]
MATSARSMGVSMRLGIALLYNSSVESSVASRVENDELRCRLAVGGDELERGSTVPVPSQRRLVDSIKSVGRLCRPRRPVGTERDQP